MYLKQLGHVHTFHIIIAMIVKLGVLEPVVHVFYQAVILDIAIQVIHVQLTVHLVTDIIPTVEASIVVKHLVPAID